MFYIKPYNTYTSGTISQSSFSVRFNCALDALENQLIQYILRKYNRGTSFKPILHFLTSKKIREDPQANTRNFIKHRVYSSVCAYVSMYVWVSVNILDKVYIGIYYLFTHPLIFNYIQSFVILLIIAMSLFIDMEYKIIG